MQTSCLAARHNLILDSTDRVTLCCNSTQNLDFANGLVDQALVGHKAKEIQQALDQGLAHVNCDRCWREQQQGTRSYRESYNDMYPEFSDLKAPQLKTIHIQNDPTCNLSCVYCGPRFSSRWADLLGHAEPMVKTLNFSDEALHNLSMITLAGGEPGLIKSNVALLDRLFVLNPTCQVIVNTNLFQINNPVFNRVLQFANNTVIASFESTGPRYDYIRHGSNWTQFSRNFANIAKQVQRLQASMILFPLSVADLPNAVDFALDHIPATEIYINDYEGSKLAWNQVGQPALNTLKENLVGYAQGADPAIQAQLLSRLPQMTSTVSVTDLADLDHFDQLIGQDHRQLFQELYQT